MHRFNAVCRLRYGKDYIPVTRAEEDLLKYHIQDKTLQVLGFVERRKVSC